MAPEVSIIDRDFSRECATTRDGQIRDHENEVAISKVTTVNISMPDINNAISSATSNVAED